MKIRASDLAIGGRPNLTPIAKPLQPPAVEPSDLRIALFSGNYNYVRDGANQSLNRLVEYLLRQGAKVRVYAPTVENPAFDHVGDLVSVPSIPFPTREEYQIAVRLPRRVQRISKPSKPNMFHVAAPDFVAHRAVTLAGDGRSR
jgi:hypothetical protein